MRHKELMRHLGVTVASGSEGHITEEEEWIHQHCPWTVQTPSSFRPTTEMQTITLRCDVRDPQLAITWSRSVTLCPFWCLAAKGGESVGICFLCRALSRLVFSCVFSRCLCLVWFGARET